MEYKKTILITGGAGFIGCNFVQYIYNKYPDYKIIVLDALTYAGSVENLPVNINKNIHFAAETHVTRSIYDNFLFFETDVLGTQTIANAVLKYNDRIEKFIHISTSEVYGTARGDMMNEDHPLMPMSPYASAKAGADRLVYSYWATYNIPAVIIRPFNNYGPYQHLEKAIPRFITSCILDEPLRVHGDGSASRDYIFVGDVCRAIDMILHADTKVKSGEVFNIATGGHRSILSIAQDVAKLMGKDESLITFIGERPGQVFRHTGDISKIKKTLNWEPKNDWLNGLEKTIQWYRDNRKWWEKQLWMREVPIITVENKKELH
jgi:dTDP-glucose 4,6-dehydratase